MPSDVFDSSDSVRIAQPLRYAQYATFHEPLQLELGGRLPEVTVAFETYGRLNSRRDNAVLICHALSGDSHVCSTTPTTIPAGGTCWSGRASRSTPIVIS